MQVTGCAVNPSTMKTCLSECTGDPKSSSSIPIRPSHTKKTKPKVNEKKKRVIRRPKNVSPAPTVDAKHTVLEAAHMLQNHGVLQIPREVLTGGKNTFIGMDDPEKYIPRFIESLELQEYLQQLAEPYHSTKEQKSELITNMKNLLLATHSPCSNAVLPMTLTGNPCMTQTSTGICDEGFLGLLQVIAESGLPPEFLLASRREFRTILTPECALRGMAMTQDNLHSDSDPQRTTLYEEVYARYAKSHGLECKKSMVPGGQFQLTILKSPVDPQTQNFLR